MIYDPRRFRPRQVGSAGYPRLYFTDSSDSLKSYDDPPGTRRRGPVPLGGMASKGFYILELYAFIAGSSQTRHPTPSGFRTRRAPGGEAHPGTRFGVGGAHSEPGPHTE